MYVDYHNKRAKWMEQNKSKFEAYYKGLQNSEMYKTLEKEITEIEKALVINRKIINTARTSEIIAEETKLNVSLTAKYDALLSMSEETTPEQLRASEELLRHISGHEQFSMISQGSKSVGRKGLSKIPGVHIDTGKGLTDAEIRELVIAMNENPELLTAKPTSRIELFARLNHFKESTKEWIAGAKVIRAGGDAGKEAVIAARAAAALKLKKNFELLKDVYTGARLLKYLPPTALISLTVDTVKFVIFGGVIDAVNARFAARRVAKIYPLMANHIPFVAGIRGHAGLIPNDDPSWQDNLIRGWFSPGTGEWTSPGNYMGWLSAMAGIEVPDTGLTSADSAFIEYYKKNLDA